MSLISAVKNGFVAQFGREPLLVAAPGRVNLIGEHTDYNNGFVLPGAVDKRIYVAIAKNGSDSVNVFAKQFNEALSFDIQRSEKLKGWVNYLIGVCYFLQLNTGKRLEGVDVYIDGDIPVGAGMSSSAALCSGFGFALNDMFELGQDRMQLARIGQKTEHEFAGVKCGIMDQFASLHGKAGHALRLDCRSLDYELVPFNYPDFNLVLVNTMVSHSLAGSEYNVRRAQCEEGVALLKKYYPEVESLRDVTYEQLTRHWKEFDTKVYDRCTYIVNENQRLLAGCDALRHGDLPGFGEMMYASHKGLSRRSEVSCKELDFLVDQTKGTQGVIGAPMMGGGFGGCTINIVASGEVATFVNRIQEAYQKHYAVVPEAYVTRMEEGVTTLVG